jgi:hypothetical protein
MLGWIIQIVIISIIFIFLVHHLITFFKTTLTIPKVKDLVNSPNYKYKNIFDTISNNTNNSINSQSYTSIDLLPTGIGINTDKLSMKDELKSFLKNQLNSSNSNSNSNVAFGSTDNIMGINSVSTDNFASFN